MSVISFAVIGKNRQPIYMKEFSGTSCTSSSTGSSSSSSSDPTRKDDELSWLGITTAAVSSSTNVQLDPNSNRNNNSSSSSSSSRFDCSIRQQFIVHDALDFMEQWIERHHQTHHTTPPPQQQQQQNAHNAMFAGLLCPIEDMKVYGYMTTTQIILLLVIQDNGMAAMDDTIQNIFTTLHAYYVEYILNPFTPLSTSVIESPRFHSQVQSYMDSYNNQALTR